MRLSSVCALSWTWPAFERAVFLWGKVVFRGHTATDSSLGNALGYHCNQAPTNVRPREAAVPGR